MVDHSEPLHRKTLSGLDLGDDSAVWEGRMAFQQSAESSAWHRNASSSSGMGGQLINGKYTCLFEVGGKYLLKSK